jgi:pilus assembly protein CpaC
MNTWRASKEDSVDRSRRSSVLPLIAAVLIAATGCVLSTVEAQAQRVIQIGAIKRTATVQVYIGKSEDVRTDTSFVDITVGDPEVADVNPLTDRTLSILGKRNGTTRVSVYAEGKKLIGVFDIEVTYDTSLIQSEVRKRFPHANLRVSAVNGRIMLSGTSPDGPTVDGAVQIAKQFGQDVINSVKVAQPQQVMLEVRFVEASRTAGRELGVDWRVVAKNVTASLGTAGLLTGNAPFGFVVAKLLGNGVAADVMIRALEERGLVRTLAEPNLVALSGDTASFLAGGEYPIPVSSNNNTVTIAYKQYGIGLAFTPTVLKDGLINMVIKPEVSQIDPNHSVAFGNGISVPALIVRRANTTVELRDGQSFMIGGLLLNVSKNSLEQFPWLSDVPVLGALFRSASYQKDETDLAIIVTPRIVRPARPGDVIKTPLDGSLPANDTDLFLMGKTEVKPAAARLEAGVPAREFTGHMLDLPKGGLNVVSVKN